MKAIAISGFCEKGPAAFLVEIAGRRLLLDLGEGPDLGRRPDISSIGRIDAILVSHGHRDHVGALDALPDLDAPPIFATPTVRALAREPELRNAEALPLRGRIQVAGLSVRTGRNGHAPGGIWLHIEAEIGILYTGDLSRESELFPFDPPPRAEALIFDASYGDYDESLTLSIAKLVQIAKERPLLLPAPADGRGLEIATRLSDAGLRVRLCPAHLAVADALLASQEPTLTVEGRARLAALRATECSLEANATPDGVMIAAKADATGGVGGALADRWRSSAEVCIVFTGHVGAGTPAERLVASGRASFLRWNVHPRLRDLRWLFETIAPQSAMPAFLPANDLAQLRRALDDPRLNVTNMMIV